MLMWGGFKLNMQGSYGEGAVVVTTAYEDGTFPMCPALTVLQQDTPAYQDYLTNFIAMEVFQNNDWCRVITGCYGRNTSPTGRIIEFEADLDFPTLPQEYTEWPPGISPALENPNPAPGETGVSQDTDISFDLLYASDDIVKVNGVIVWSNDSPQSGWSVSKKDISGGYTYTLSSPGQFSLGSTVTVSVTAAQGFSESWSFYIEAEQAYSPGGPVSPPITNYPEGELFEFFSQPLQYFDFPLQFKENCDVQKTSLTRGVEHGLRLSVMLRLRGIPLAAHLGSIVSLLPFDQNDESLKSVVAEEILRSTRIGESRALVGTSVVFSEENKVTAIVPYTIVGTFHWESLRLSIPIQELE
jgi:hypothetical protein